MTTSPSPAQFATPEHPSPADLAEALEGVHDLGALPLAEHVSRFNALHDSMITALAAVDEV